MLVDQCVCIHVCVCVLAPCVGGLVEPRTDHPKLPPPSVDGVVIASFGFFPLLATGARIKI